MCAFLNVNNKLFFYKKREKTYSFSVYLIHLHRENPSPLHVHLNYIFLKGCGSYLEGVVPFSEPKFHYNHNKLLSV